MKVALVHDWLSSTRGGAESVFLEIAHLYPEADIYTLLYDPKTYPELNSRLVYQSILAQLPDSLSSRRKYLLPLIPLALRLWDFSNYDLVISSSGAYCKNIHTPRTQHISYCHTPARILHGYFEAYAEENNLGALSRICLRPVIAGLRYWDVKNTRFLDHVIANSNTVARRITEAYGINATVMYPFFDPSILKESLPESKKDYFVTLGTLTPYKMNDFVIEAIQQTDAKLIIIGDGPDKARLQSIANEQVSFAGRVSEKEKRTLLKNARALIHPHEEDFGISAIEALGLGTAVITHNQGGTTETVSDQTTGCYFDNRNPTSLVHILNTFDSNVFEPVALRNSVKQFSKARFSRQFATFVSRAKINDAYVLGIYFRLVSFKQALAEAKKWMAQGQIQTKHIVTVNTEFIMQAQTDAEFRNVLNSSALSVADGVGVVWAAKKFGLKLPERIAGSDLGPELLRNCAEDGKPVGLVLNSNGLTTKEELEATLQAQFPSLDFKIYEATKLSLETDTNLLNEISKDKLHLLLVGIGAPHQDRWIHDNKDVLNARVAIGVGGTFDFMSGAVKRAPLWMRSSGLEWMYRLMKQPKRIIRQLSIPQFIYRVLSAARIDL